MAVLLECVHGPLGGNLKPTPGCTHPRSKVGGDLLSEGETGLVLARSVPRHPERVEHRKAECDGVGLRLVRRVRLAMIAVAAEFLREGRWHNPDDSPDELGLARHSSHTAALLREMSAVELTIEP